MHRRLSCIPSVECDWSAVQAPNTVCLFPADVAEPVSRLPQGDAAKLGAVYDSIASGFVEKGLDTSAVEPVRCGYSSSGQAGVLEPKAASDTRQGFQGCVCFCDPARDDHQWTPHGEDTMT